MADILDDIMGFSPASVVDAFNSSEKKSYSNPNIYKTNPKNSKSEDGHYHSRIRVLLNPYDLKRSIVHQVVYSLHDAVGFFQAPSMLAVGDKNCPIFKAWKQLWFAPGEDTDKNGRKCDLTKRDFCKEMFDKSESDWVLVQIIEDENQPELTGQFKFMKMPKAIMNRMMAKMNPTDPKKTQQPLMDYLFGPVLEMNVTPGPDDVDHPERKNREISYDLCDFDTEARPIMKTDGTELFTDEELETIEAYNDAQNQMLKAKTETKRQEAEAKKVSLREEVKAIYQKALDYMKTYGINLVEECGYKPWSPELTSRVNAWIEEVVNMRSPMVGAVVSSSPVAAAPVSTPAAAPAPAHGGNTEPFTSAPEPIDDLPF